MPLAFVTFRSSAGQRGAAHLTGWLCGILVPTTLGPKGCDGVPRDSSCGGSGALVRQNTGQQELAAAWLRGPGWLGDMSRAKQ